MSSLECELSQMGKHHHVPYLLRVNKRVDHPFELVHSDIWGPCPFSLTLDFKYFIIFVDDFSRVTWLYLMKSFKGSLHF